MKNSAATQSRQKIWRLEKYDFLALFCCFIFFVVWMAIIVYKYVHFGYYDWDLAFFTQAMWNLLHGSQYVSLVGINFFGDHSYYIAFLFLPLFALFPHPITLVVIKIIAYLAGGFILFKLSKEKLGEIWALIIMILYITFPPNIFAILYDFNIESVSPFFLFLMFYFFKSERLKPFVIVSFFTLLIKENMSLVLIAFGIYALFSKRKNKIAWSFLPIFAGIIIFYLLAMIAIPSFRELPTHAFLVRYHYLGNSVGEIIHNIVFNPFKIITILSGPLNLRFISELFGPLLVPAFLSPHILFLTSPILLQHLLSSHSPEHSIYYHYALSIAPFIFLAVVNTLTLCRERFKPRIYNPLFYMLFFSCVINTFLYIDPFMIRMNYHNDQWTPIRWEMVKKIPQEASVITTFGFLAELSRRKDLYSFHKIYNEYYQIPQKIVRSELYTGRPFKLPQNVSYALIDFKDPWLMVELQDNTPLITSKIQNFFSAADWSVHEADGDIVLFKKGAGEKKELIEKSKIPFLRVAKSSTVTIDQAFDLTSFHSENPMRREGIIIPFTFYWHCLSKVDENYQMIVTLTKENKIMNQETRNIGYAIFPTSNWQKEEYIKEHYNLYIPTQDKGEYLIEISFRNPKKQEMATLVKTNLPLTPKQNILILGKINIP